MQESDREDFSNCISALFFDREATEAMFLAYWMGLSDLTLEQVQQAVWLAIREAKGPSVPRPAELRELVFGKTEDRALLAWNDVLRAVPLGPYKHIDFQDRVINAAIRSLGGWPNYVARFTGADEEKWARLDFLRTYRGFLSSGVNGEACEPLPGLSEKQVVQGKLVTPVPRKIACDASRVAAPKRIETQQPFKRLEQANV